MLTLSSRYLIFNCVVIAALLCPFVARAQQPAPTAHRGGSELMRRDVVGMPGKEVVVSTVEFAPGVHSRPHRHDAQVFVYVLQGRVVMQVKGGPRLTLGPGQTFYEGPDDIHTVSDDASSTEPAKILVFMIKDKGKPGIRYVTPESDP